MLLGLILLLLFALLFTRLLRTKGPQVRTIIKKPFAFDLYQMLIESGFNYRMAQMITAQAAHETANFESHIFKANKNPFGMTMPEKRRTVAKGKKNGYAYYESYKDSVKDYRLYYLARQYPKEFETVDQFIEAIKRKGYFTAPIAEYKTAVNKFYNAYWNAT